MSTFYENTLRYLITCSIEDLILFLRQNNVLQREVTCGSCSMPLKGKKYKQNIDGYVFRCYTKTCVKYHTTTSIRIGSFLLNSKISLKNWVEILYRFSKEEPIKKTKDDLTISTPTLIKIHKLLRGKISRLINDNPITLGGDGVICQIDESFFCHKPKYHRGRPPDYQI